MLAYVKVINFFTHFSSVAYFFHLSVNLIRFEYRSVGQVERYPTLNGIITSCPKATTPHRIER